MKELNEVIRLGKLNDYKWVNEQYRKVKFKESSFENEIIVIIEVNSSKVGLGRLQKIDDNNAELGGIYVEPEFRGKGLARKIVSFLLENSSGYKTIYCLPFSNLSNFYKIFGFKELKGYKNIPRKVTDKHKWCNLFYKKDTLLLILNK